MFCIGLDIGYSQLKVVMGELDGRPESMILPAGACPATR